jgi:hypothetical protein
MVGYFGRIGGHGIWLTVSAGYEYFDSSGMTRDVLVVVGSGL